MKDVSLMLPTGKLLRLPHIIGKPKANPPIAPIIPVSRSTWWKWVKEGKAPKPIKIGSRISVWRDVDVYALVEELRKGKENPSGNGLPKSKAASG